ncbi:MAG TPA: AsmA-like C-terminal region-containing protein [Balneolaceae bacterium]|nr:AsmA-like C-terminal region-containing protein [Balneolaceae bacterium]
MKTVLKIVAGILVLFILIGVALNLYFTDERLKNTVMPHVDKAVGRQVDVGSMSLTFFSTFPEPGISIQKLRIPGKTKSDTLLSLDELVASVNIFSLMGDQIDITQIQLRHPKFTYVVYPDSTTNIDFLLKSQKSKKDTTGGYAFNIPSFRVSGGNFGYRDEASKTNIQLHDLDADISLNYAKLIKSTVDANLGGLTASINDTSYINGLPLSLSQQSTIDLDRETVTLDKGTFSIRGLALNLSGSLSNWSKTLTADLKFSSSSDDFGELLRLIPAQYDKYTKGLETKGSLAINGTLEGPLGSKEIPKFDITMNVDNGYVKNPNLPQPIQNVQLSAKANNNLLTVDKLKAKAGENNLSASGKLTKPLEDNGDFNIDLDADVNLSTVKNFYDISRFDIQQMDGQLKVKGTASGNRSKPENTRFDAVAQLKNGSLKYSGVSKAIENISVDAKANQSAITITNMQLKAAGNTFSMKGVINQPLKEKLRNVDLSTDLKFDLATIKEFYPINEDSLSMRGQLIANATLKGKADQIEKAVQKGQISLSNGYISYKTLGKPIQDLTLNSTFDGPTMKISKASFKTGKNSLSATGTITDYLSDNRSINLDINGNADLAEISNYYDLKPTITKLNGKADLNLKATGPIADPADMKFDGQLVVNDMNMDGDGVVQPVTNLNGKLDLNPKTAKLTSLKFKIGSSDIALNGSLTDYMNYLKSEKDRKTTPQLTGSYKSNLLNLDELIDWSDTTTSKTPINLPDLNSSVDANISKLIVTGVPMHNLQAQATTTPKQIKLNKATVEMFDGKASGAFTWDVPKPDHTMITFHGNLDSLEASSFFKEYPVLGKKSKFHDYLSGAFSADVDYYSELNVYLDPLIQTTKMNGSFGMTKARLKGHPVQDKIASLLKANEFKNVALDQWKSTFSMDNSILTIKNLRLTSGDIGMELNGTHQMVKNDINYQIKLYLPGRFKGAIASVITKQAVDALTQKNGTIMLPLRATGTQENPTIAPDKEVITPIIKDYLKNKAGNVLNKLFGNH